MSAGIDEQQAEHKENIARTLALSDGVFAVAITLLVLDIRIPSTVPPDQLLVAILRLAPNIESYVISFLVIGVYWNVHRSMFRAIRRFDAGLSWLNLLFLLSLAFLPVPTAVLGSYDTATSVIFYALSISLTGLLSCLLWTYVTWRHRLVNLDFEQRRMTHGIVSALIAPAVFLLSIGLAFVNIFAPVLNGPDLAQTSWLLIWVLIFLHNRRAR